MEIWKCHRFVSPQVIADSNDVDMHKVVASAESYPYISSWLVGKEGMELPHDDDNNISIHCAHQGRGRAIIKSILQVNKHLGISFFVVSWLHAVAGASCTHCVPDVANICLPSGHLVNLILLERNVKSSYLLTESHRKQDAW